MQTRFHDLRHTHATLLLESGVPVKAISKRLGHATTAITEETYLHVTERMRDEAAMRVGTILPILREGDEPMD